MARKPASQAEKSAALPNVPEFTKDQELKAYRDMLSTVTDRIKALMKAGKKLDEIKAANPSAEYDEKWGKAFISPGRFVEMLVAAYS